MINLCKLKCINNLIQISIHFYYNEINYSDSEHNNIAAQHKDRLHK